jgi:hypothetical protein
MGLYFLSYSYLESFKFIVNSRLARRAIWFVFADAEFPKLLSVTTCCPLKIEQQFPPVVEYYCTKLYVVTSHTECHELV